MYMSTLLTYPDGFRVRGFVGVGGGRKL